MHAETALHEYMRRAQKLSTLLTHSSGLTTPSDEFLSSSKNDDKYIEVLLKIQHRISQKSPIGES